MNYDCAPLKWVNRWQDLSCVCGLWLWVARDREVREKSSGMWSIYGEKEKAWSED